MTPIAPLRLAGVPVLMLHGLCERVPDYVCFAGSRTCMLPVEAFDTMLRWLRRHFDIVRVGDIADALKPGSRCRPVMVTFDDALASVVDHAVPLLRAHGESALVFVTTQWTDGRKAPFIFELERLVYEREPEALDVEVGPLRYRVTVGSRARAGMAMAALWTWLFDNRLAPLGLRPEHVSLDGRSVSSADLPEGRNVWSPASWDELRAGADSGAIEIGSHMASHTPLSWLEEPALIEELAGSRARLELEFSRPVTACAYPHGKNSPLAASVAFRTFDWAFLGRGGLLTARSVRSDAPRVHVPGEGWSRIARDLRLRRWDRTGVGVKLAHGVDALRRKAARFRETR